jgi:predicted nucleotidyltransferase
MTNLKVDIPRNQIAAFCRRHQICRMAVFGSAVSGGFGPHSDIDVLVEFEPEAEIGFVALNRMRRELEALLGRPVDLMPREGLKPVIREAVLSRAQEIYAA